jgi:hypothetical protein
MLMRRARTVLMLVRREIVVEVPDPMGERRLLRAEQQEDANQLQ